VFISIHHNSTASADPSINETQTYYPLGDGGASLDLARAIHRHLVMNLNISPAKIMPGNFHVLRHATVPAVLGEPAMISNPVMAGRLSQAASLELEAEAYFLGILDYFASGTPAFSSPTVSSTGCVVTGDTIICPPSPLPISVQWHFETKVGEPGPDPVSFQLLAANEDLPFSVSPNGRTVSWVGHPPGEEAILLHLSGRNLGGRSTPVRTTTILSASTDLTKQTIIAENSANPGTRLSLLHSQGPIKVPSGHKFQGNGIQIGTDYWALIETTGKETESPLPPGLQWRLLQSSQDITVANISWRERLPVMGSKQTQFVQNYYAPAIALPTIEAETAPVWIEMPGFMPLVDPNPSRSDLARTVYGTGRHWPLEPLIGQLHGRVIVLDAAGGGAINQGQGPLGTRGSDLNLETAHHLKDLLVGSGAKVVLTRSGEAMPRPESKVKLANEAGADFFLTIARSPQDSLQIAIHHHPQSKRGIAWATSTGKYLSPMLDEDETLTVTRDWAYLLRHTACPAVTVNFPLPNTVAQENKQRTPGWAQTEARALYLALIEQVLPPEKPLKTFDPAVVISALPNPVFDLQDIQWALIDGNLPWYPASASFFIGSLNPAESVTSWQGPGLPNMALSHTLELHTSEGWQLWIWQTSTAPSAAKLLLEGK